MNMESIFLDLSKIKRVVCGVFVLCIVTIMLFGCSSSKKEQLSEDEFNSLIENLIESDSFSADMINVNEKTIKNYYRISGDKDIEVVKAYMGDGASAEEMVLFKSDDTKKVKSLVNEYKDDKYETYASYLPEEAAKIKDAIVKEYDGYVLVCIANNYDKADKLIKEAGN